MTERQLQNTVSLFLILAHLLIVLIIFGLFLAGGLSSKDRTVSLSIIVPMLGAFTGLALTYAVAYQPVCMLSQSASRSGEALQLHHERRTNNDKDRGVAQESARNGSCALVGAAGKIQVKWSGAGTFWPSRDIKETDKL
jgi:hypothetical protein